MRIIAGINKSRKLYTLDSLQTRPTTDKIRGAIFNVIGPYFAGETVLDLFAGSGALSLESLSRGASHATLVDASKKAIEVIRKNVTELDYQKQTTIIKQDYKRFLEETNQTYDMIFLDPPYHMNIILPIIEMILQRNLLNKNGLLICEYEKNKTISTDDESLEHIKTKQYGITTITILKKR